MSTFWLLAAVFFGVFFFAVIFAAFLAGGYLSDPDWQARRDYPPEVRRSHRHVDRPPVPPDTPTPQTPTREELDHFLEDMRTTYPPFS
jgi:hypothetical protein